MLEFESMSVVEGSCSGRMKLDEMADLNMPAVQLLLIQLSLRSQNDGFRCCSGERALAIVGIFWQNIVRL
jgi:hypothetical protein